MSAADCREPNPSHAALVVGIAGADGASVAVAGAVADGAGVVFAASGSDAGDSVSRIDGAVDG